MVNADDEMLVLEKLPNSPTPTPTLRAAEEKSKHDEEDSVRKLRSSIRSSKHKPTIKYNFISMSSKDVNQTKWCFELAEKLKDIITNNKTRIDQEWFSANRDGSKRHQILEKNLNIVIETLSYGNLNHAKDLIMETIQQLRISQSTVFFQSAVPEIEVLNKLFDHVKRGKAVDLQPSLIKKTSIAA